MFRTEAEFLAGYGWRDRQEASKRMFKDTDCGAWIEFEDGSVVIGSIVEGCDFGTATYRLTYPFSAKDFDERMEAIEKEADELWTWANEDDTEMEAPYFPEFESLNPEGRSA